MRSNARTAEAECYVVAGSAPPIACGVGDYTARLASQLSLQVSLRAAQLKGTRPLCPSVHWVRQWSLTELLALLRDVRRTSPRVLSVQYPTAAYRRSLSIHALVPLVRVLPHRPTVVVTLHEQAAAPWFGLLRNWLMTRLADGVVVSNQLDYDALPSRVAKRSTIIPIGSSITLRPLGAASRSAVRNELGVGADEDVIVYFGHSWPSKRVPLLLEAMRDLPGVRLLVVSRLDPTANDHHGTILDMVEEINAREPGTVIVVPDADDGRVSELLQAADVFVIPDSHPLTAKSSTAAAAARHGLPVVGQRAPLPEQNLPFRDGVNAVLVDVDDAATLAAAVRTALADRALRLRSATAADPVAGAADWQEIADRHVAFWSRLGAHDGQELSR